MSTLALGVRLVNSNALGALITLQIPSFFCKLRSSTHGFGGGGAAGDPHCPSVPQVIVLLCHFLHRKTAPKKPGGGSQEAVLTPGSVLR